MAMSTKEARWMRQTGCMTMKRAIRTGRILARKLGRPVKLYDCGRTAACYKVTGKREHAGGTWCVYQGEVRPRTGAGARKRR